MNKYTILGFVGMIAFIIFATIAIHADATAEKVFRPCIDDKGGEFINEICEDREINIYGKVSYPLALLTMAFTAIMFFSGGTLK